MASARRLAAIMFTDMVGYSALAQRDEPLALRLVDVQRALVRPIFRSHRGREVNRMGDGFLVEFPSALEALECAIDVQRALLDHNERAGAERVELRIGIHLGDVIDQAGDLLGDAVNIAARIEPLAEASGVCISGPVFDQIRNKVPYSCTQLEHAFLKNIDTPITVYSVDLPWHGPSAARITPWTDREAEVDALNGALKDAAAGRGQVIALSGEPGIGKTRLATETIRRGSAKGFRTLRGRGIQDQVGVPYGPWAEAVRGFVRDAPDPMLYKLCTRCQAAMVSLVPELADRIGPGPATPALDPEQARLAFFEGVTQFIRNISQEGPLLLLLDDIQWADVASVRLIEYLARQVPSQRLLLILSYRDSDVAETEHLRGALSELRKDHILCEVPVKRMAAEPSRRLVSAILGGETPLSNVVGIVHDRAGGNPLFAEELLRSMIEEQQLVRQPDGWSVQLTAEVAIPSSMRELIVRRVGRVSDESRAALSVASVLRGEFEFDLLLQLSGHEEEALIRSVEELLRARLLREREYEPGHPMYRFADDETQSVLYREFSLVRRQRLHLRVARLLEEQHAGHPEAIAAQLAEHFYRGSERPKALHYSILAGQGAAAVFAHEEAMRHFEIALELMNQLEGPGRARSREQTLARGRLLEALGLEAQFLARFALAADRLEEAAQLFEESGERIPAGTDLLAAGRIRAWALRSLDQGLSLMLKARALVESEPECRLHAELCLELGGVATEMELPQLPSERALLEQALSVARATHAPDLEARAFIGLAWLEPPEGRETAHGNLAAALELARTHNLVVGPTVLWNRVWELLWMDTDATAAVAIIDEGIRWSQRIRDRFSEMVFRGNQLPIVWVLTGEMDRASAGAQAGARFFKDVGLPDVLNYQIRAHIEMIGGDLDRAADLLESARSLLRTGPDTAQFVYESYLDGWLRSERNDVDGALAALEDGVAVCDRRRYPAVVATFWALLLARAVDVSIRLPEAAEAARRASAYLERLHRIARVIPVAANRGLALRATAAWASREGRTQDEIRSLEESATCWREVGWPYELAATLERLGLAYRAAHDAESADRAIGEAATLFGRLKARRDLERVLGSMASRPA